MKLLASLRPETRLGRPVALTTLFAFLIATVPGPALASAVRPVERFAASLNERPDGYGVPMPKSRLLTAAMMDKAQGRTGENPYLAGQAKWDVVYKGIDVTTGNYSTSGTDLTFEGGYGIPVNVTRSYSANNPDEGPLGKGWNLSVDVRSTAGGLIKSGGSPVRAVPTAFKDRPSAQIDPNAELATGVAAQPVEAVVATDAGGTEETVQVDADGVLTTPPWDKNTNETTYENVVQTDGSILRRTLTNKTFTPDGTVYLYQRLGTYPNGTRPWDNPSAASEPSDVMKIVSATDRQGNVTTYSYGTTEVTFQKANGTVTEQRLESIHMPNGHHISFTWSGNRMTSASDGVRTVQYAYTNGLLTGVTTPGGKTTTYGYGAPWVASNWTGEVASNVLNSVTDPRGLTTTIKSMMANVGMGYVPGVATYRIVAPNGVNTNVLYGYMNISGQTPPDAAFGPGYDAGNGWVSDSIGGPTGPRIAYFQADTAYVNTSGLPNTFYISLRTIDVYNPYTYLVRLPVKESYYSLTTQDLLEESVYADPAKADDGKTTRRLPIPTYGRYWVRSVKSYNFRGDPLTATTYENVSGPPNTPTSTIRTGTVRYAYWPADKYYQQKGVLDTGGRIAVTDYYDKDAPAGSRGQTAKVWDWKYGGVASASGFAAGNGWKYDVAGDPAKYAARFEYDAKGRPTDVWKLRSAPIGGAYGYVQTHTLYGADTDGSWGQASSVTEDYGGINRTTSTLHYDACGRADKVQDAKGQVFETHYDLDGVVQGVDRISGGVASPVVTYSYGTSGLTNGQVLSVKDELSGVLQEFGYVTVPGGGLGQVSGVAESGGPNPAYSTGYTYTAAGDRETATYATPEGTTKWEYRDYLSVGTPGGQSRAFQTLTRLTPGGMRTAEEFHYGYDALGRLTEAAFAQTPSAGSASTGGWYRDASGNNVRAASRARAHYEYDAGGRLKLIAHWWDTLQGNNSYTSVPILANECDYETTGLNRGLKTASRFYKGLQSGSTWSWDLKRTETYGYDDKNDQLTGANYGDAGANAVQSWSYDAAGNRISDSSQPGSWSYDNLNRILSSPQGTYTHDILGNRLTGPASTSHVWDSLGRMTSLTKGGATTTYAYRADGMRVAKTGASSGEVYRYDGQMPVETVEMTGSTVSTVERHALGARGTDMIERVTSSGTQTRFPLYDAHGNSVATLGRPATTGALPSLGDERSYDAWGRVRIGLQTGAPSARYCASLGHVQDDESGLVYMRARYYEPGTGRFVSEDPAHDGVNWFAYCGNNSVNRVDRSGKEYEDEFSQMGRDLIEGGLMMLGRGVGQVFAGATVMRKGAASYYNGTFECTALLANTVRMKLMGVATMLYGGISSITGAKRVAAGMYTIMAGKMLEALGEDGLEYANAYLDAAGDQLGVEKGVWQ